MGDQIIYEDETSLEQELFKNKLKLISIESITDTDCYL